ncbi:MAG: WD40/YVTN/BNR-like repeat-containing protein, partial [Anaerolineae bacterium]
DGGSTWAAINNGLTSLEINALLVDPGNPQVVYAGTVNGLFKTVDGGELWSPADDGLTNRNVKALTIDPTDSQVLYAGTGGAGLFRTADGGARWAATAFQNHARPEGDVRSLAIDPFDSATVYIGTAEGLFKLAGGGASYVSLNTPIDDSPVGSVAFDPRDPEVVYAGQFCWRDIFKSENGGDDWRWIGPAGDWHKDHTYVMEIGIDPSDPQALYTTTVDGIFKSFDGGEGWATFLNPLQHRHLHGFAIAPSSPNILYAGTAEGGVPVAGAHVYRSVNRGASWQQMDNGFPTDRETSIEVIAVDPMDADVVYVGTSSHHFGFAEDVEAVGIFKSVNGGEKWDAINRGLTNLEIHDIAIDPSDPDVLYAATGEGVFRSTDGGGRWQAASQGLLASEVTSLAIHPSSPAVIYAGTSGGGVFKSRDGGDNWYPVDFGLTAFSVGDLALDASGEVIYAAALTGGVFRGRAQPLVHKVYLPLIAKDRP